MNGRCFLVYALAPEGTTAREANDRPLSAVAFTARTSCRLESYRDIGLAQLAGADLDDPGFWWRRRNE